MSILTEREFLPIGNCKDITGQKFGKLTAIGLTRKGPAYWLFSCECGTIKEINGSNVETGKVATCGCGAKSKVENPRLLSIWASMKQRCGNPRCKSYGDYGGRGISVCDEWVNSFLQFQSWALNNGYGDSLTIDRIENDEGYSPSNCRWVTRKAQQNNRRVNVFLTAFGETKTMKQWVEDPRCTVNYTSLAKRLKKGATAEEAIESPVEFEERRILAWGEVKNVMDWTKDPRCQVSYVTLTARLNRRGMTHEDAISTPANHKRPPAFDRTGLGAAPPRYSISRSQANSYS